MGKWQQSYTQILQFPPVKTKVTDFKLLDSSTKSPSPQGPFRTCSGTFNHVKGSCVCFLSSIKAHDWPLNHRFEITQMKQWENWFILNSKILWVNEDRVIWSKAPRQQPGDGGRSCLFPRSRINCELCLWVADTTF